tara:strand:- start:9098 stop:10699 length:1602 start_codon:yes stop_codon:yes gene_type:complete
VYDHVTASLVNNNNETIESYPKQDFNNNRYIIGRIFNTPNIKNFNSYFINLEFENKENLHVKTIPVNLERSIIIDSICSSESCETISGNVLEKVPFKIKIVSRKIQPLKFVYTVSTPYNSYEFISVYSLPVENDWIEGIVLDAVPQNVSSYIALITIKAIDTNNDFAITKIPIKVVRPVEVKHFGKHELAEVYEPVPVTGCIPGTVGSNVQYSESTSETRQNSVSLTVNKTWSDSFSSNESRSISEGITVGETQSTVNLSSMSSSETQNESYANTTSEGESNAASFDISEGENWSWSLGESNSQSQGQSQTENTDTGVNASTTVGVSGEGSLPFLAKASGKVEVSGGVSRGWGESNNTSSSETSTENRGYSTGGGTQTGRSYGSVQNDSKSHTLSGTYALSNSSSSTISESSSLSSGRVWNMTESINSGKVVTEGNGESISQTIVNSSSSSTTFSYSGYIPRGRFGIFFRQTSRYVKLSEIITYDINGFAQHAGFIMMNTWAWAPELSVSNTCEDAMTSSLPIAECLIPPCGE